MPSPANRFSPRKLLAVGAAAAVLAVSTAASVAAAPPDGSKPDKTAPPTTTAPAPGPSTTAPAAPTTAAPTTSAPAGTAAIGDVVNVGDAKPARFYDGYLATALADIQAWWQAEYTRLYGEPWEPLAGGIYAAYPERTAPIPGCGFPGNTSYQEVSDFGAFYCPDGDFIAYDDGEQGIIHQLAETFSPSIVAVVLAHEFGHAIQFRTGDLDRPLPTVYTEQQADCISGAWAGRVWRGEVPGLAFGDEDIRTGLIALVAVRDPIGPNVLESGGHGSGFDRIGAFQEGFSDGIDACVGLIDSPLPLLSNEFASTNDQAINGNAPFGWEASQVMKILGDDLTAYWPAALAAEGVSMPAVTLRASTNSTADHCGDPQGMAAYGSVYCATSNEVVFDEAYGREIYHNFGDFAVGYVVGLAWADAAQAALGSQLQGEQRVLASDCLVGAWIGSATPEFGPDPTATGPQPDHTMTVSPGDFDEAIQTALVVGDPSLATDVEGSAFEKIAAMRRGVIDGLDACLADIAGTGAADTTTTTA